MKFFRVNKDEMPFLDHLEELRWRLIWSLGSAILGAIIIGLISWVASWFIGGDGKPRPANRD